MKTKVIILSFFILQVIFCLPAHNIVKSLSESKKVYEKLKFLPNWRYLLARTFLKNPNLIPSIQESLCGNKLLHMLNNFISDPSIPIFLAYSGGNINEFGNYEECKEQDNSYYVTLGISFSGFIGIKLGLCIPNECTISELDKSKPYLAKMISEIIQMQLSEKDINYIDNYVINQEMSKPGTMTYIGFCIALTILIISVLASILDYHKILDRNKETSKQFIIFQILQCFSLGRNIKSILASDNRIDRKLDVFNGIRVISILWVIIGHTFSMSLSEGVRNIMDAFDDLNDKFWLGVIKAGSLAVDVFFFLSGFLAALGFYKAFKEPKNRTIANVLLAYFHRYMRLLPMFLFTYIYTTYFLPRSYDSTIMFSFKDSIENCKQQWYWTFLYLNNFINQFDKLCIGWVWYLFNDMQFFIVLPAFIWLYSVNKKYGLLSIFGAIFVFFIIQLAICIYYDFNLSYAKRPKYDSGTIFYGRPYCRIIPYLMGTLLFIIYEEAKDPESGSQMCHSIKSFVNQHRFIRYFMYFIGWGLMHLSVYSFYWIDKYPNDWNDAFGIFHMITVRPVFIFGLILILYPVLIGNASIFLSIFGHFVWSPLAKLTYGAYMLHIPLLIVIAASERQSIFYSIGERHVRGFLVTFISYLVSFVITLLFESPTVMLLKNFLEGSRKPSLQNKSAINEKTPDIIKIKSSEN